MTHETERREKQQHSFDIDRSAGSGIALGAESNLYIYKNLKPYYKYTVPHGGPKYDQEVRRWHLSLPLGCFLLFIGPNSPANQSLILNSL